MGIIKRKTIKNYTLLKRRTMKKNVGFIVALCLLAIFITNVNGATDNQIDSMKKRAGRELKKAPVEADSCMDNTELMCAVTGRNKKK